MLTGLRIRNFKGWKDTGDIRLAPLTVLFGANSSGKSSLGHLLLALKQTAASADRRRALHTGDEASLVDLGTFVSCLHGHDAKAQLEFTLEWSSSAPIRAVNPLENDQAFEGHQLMLATVMAANAKAQPVVRELRYALKENGEVCLSATLRHPEAGTPQLDSMPDMLVRATGRQWPLDPPEKFYRISDRSLARYQNADFLAEFALQVERNLESLSYLGPLREHPRRVYAWSGNSPGDVGSKGEYSIAAILAAETEARTLNRARKKKTQTFAAFVATWLKELGVIESFEVKRTAEGRKEHEVKVKTFGGLTEVDLPDVGFGVSQVLPAVVQAFYCPEGSTVWMEQPEIHLHPRVQAELADVFICAIQAHEHGRPRNVQLVIETHSEHFLSRLQRRIAEGKIGHDQVAMYFARASKDHSTLEALEVNVLGEITNWPENFFGDEMGDLVARTKAAAERQERGARR